MRPMPTPGSTASTRPTQAWADPETASWAHGRAKFFDLARINKARSREAVARIDDYLQIEREING